MHRFVKKTYRGMILIEGARFPPFGFAITEISSSSNEYVSFCQEDLSWHDSDRGCSVTSVDLGRPRSATSPVHRSSLHLCTGVSPCALGCFRTQILLSSVDLGRPWLATPNIYSSVWGRLLSSATTSTARHRQVQGAGSIVPIADIQYLPTLCQMRAATLELTSALSMRGCVQHGSAPDPLPNTHSG